METKDTSNTHKLYVMAVLMGRWELGRLKTINILSYCIAKTQQEAIGDAYETYSQQYPSEDGWNSPSITASELPDTIWKEVEELNGN